MSALLTMVGVSSTVTTLKVATSAPVPLATPWTAMNTTVQVDKRTHVLAITHFFLLLNEKL